MTRQDWFAFAGLTLFIASSYALLIILVASAKLV
jgi:hypothetical protein